VSLKVVATPDPATKAQLDRIEASIAQILKQETINMAAIDDLKSAVVALNTAVTNELTAIGTALSSNPTAADVETQVSAINALTAKLAAETVTLTGTPIPPAA
jgi:hypothetical protein